MCASERKLQILLSNCNPTKLFYFLLFPKPLMLFSSFAPGGSHTRAGDRCGRAAGHAQWCRARSQSQGSQGLSSVKPCSHSDGNIMVFMQTVVLFFLQDLLVDCFKPTEVSPFLQAFLLLFLPLLYLLFLTHSPPVFGPSRTSSQSCLTRFEGCRSSPRLRRNDSVPPSPPPQPSPLVFLPQSPFYRCTFS